MPGLRETLEETYDEIAAGDLEGVDAAPEAPDAPEEAPAAETDEPSLGEAGEGEQRPRDESGRFLKQDTKPEQARPPPPSRPGQGAVAGIASPPPAPPATPPAFPRAPQSWKPGTREKWAALPAEVQAEVVRREREIAQGLQKVAEAEKGVNGWQEVVRPYEAQIRQMGVEPAAYVGDLLKTAHALTYGAPPQKADLLANLVMQFGITPQDLDRALVARIQGQGAPQQRAQPQQPMRDPRLDEFFQTMQQQSTQEADETAAGFAETHEFFEDVAAGMADWLDLWAKQGKTRVTEKDLERAYNLACNDNEDVVSTLEQRKAVEAARTQQQVTERSKLAASSVGSQPAAGGAAQPSGGRRALLEARYDELDR